MDEIYSCPFFFKSLPVIFKLLTKICAKLNCKRLPFIAKDCFTLPYHLKSKYKENYNIMVINKKTYNGWKILKEHGDVEEIHQFSKDPKNKLKEVSRITIGAALRSGRMNESTFEVISKFYNKKKKKQDKIEAKSLTAYVEDDRN